MPTTIQIKYSETPGAAPTTSDITVPAELALNVADGQLYTRDASDNIIKLGSSSSTGGDNTFEGNVTVDGDVDVGGDLSVTGDVVFSGGGVIRPGVVNSTATSYTLASTDENKLIIITNASAISVTAPLEATTSLPIGFITHIHQGGAGQITIAGEGGVTVNSALSLVTRAQYSALSLFKVGTNEWVAVGDQE